MLRGIGLGLCCAALAFGSLPALAQAQAAPSAAQGLHLFAIMLRPGPAWQAGRALKDQKLAGHFQYWKALFDQGRIVTAGPLGTEDGLVLLYAADQSDADAILRADPAVARQVFAGSALPYAPAMISPAPLRLSKP